MANEENLIPVTKRTKSEAREISKKGGQASGEARRKKRSMKQELDAILSLTANEENVVAFDGIISDDSDASNQTLIMASAVKQALRGNVKAMQLIVNIMGGTDREKQQMKMDKQLQKARIEMIQAQTDKLRADSDENEIDESDGFIEALRGVDIGSWDDEES